MQQHRVTGLHRIHRFDEEVCGHPLQERRGGDIEADPVGHLRDEIGWRNTVFRVGADGVGARNPVADMKRRHPVTHRGDGSGDLGAENER